MIIIAPQSICRFIDTGIHFGTLKSGVLTLVHTEGEGYFYRSHGDPT